MSPVQTCFYIKAVFPLRLRRIKYVLFESGAPSTRSKTNSKLKKISKCEWETCLLGFFLQRGFSRRRVGGRDKKSPLESP